MLFSLKNTSATYQQEMTITFNEILGDMVEFYVIELWSNHVGEQITLKHPEVVFNPVTN